MRARRDRSLPIPASGGGGLKYPARSGVIYLRLPGDGAGTGRIDGPTRGGGSGGSGGVLERRVLDGSADQPATEAP